MVLHAPICFACSVKSSRWGMMLTFHGMVPEDPTNLALDLMLETSFSMGGESVYGGGYVEDEMSDTDRGI
jgi:hypothetical protein